MARRSVHAARFEAYKAFHADLSNALHAQELTSANDPGVNQALEGEAARLAIDLRRVTTRLERAWVLRRAFGWSSPFLVERVERALDRFQSATAKTARSGFSR